MPVTAVSVCSAQFEFFLIYYNRLRKARNWIAQQTEEYRQSAEFKKELERLQVNVIDKMEWHWEQVGQMERERFLANEHHYWN